MPTVRLPSGQTAAFPDEMDPAHIQAAIESHLSEQAAGGGAPSPAAHPPVDMKGPLDTALANNPGPQAGGTAEHLRPVGNIGRRAARNLTGLVTGAGLHPWDLTGASLPRYTADTQGVTDAAGDLLTGELIGGGVKAAAGPVASGLNAAGRGLKSAGALTSRVTVGAPPPVDTLGADIGAGLSENRVVGISPRSLSRKVAAKVGPAAEVRDTILSQSTAPPTDISGAVTKPFDDITAVKTDPRTGAARPAALSKANTARRAVTEVQSPDGTFPGQMKDPRLSPLEMSQLGKNVYAMTDYTAAENELANQGLKGAGAALRDKILEVAPESSTATRNVHNLMGAEDHLKMKTGPPPEPAHSLFQAGARATKAATTGLGTAAGAALDMAGSGLMDLGGAVRRTSSPVAPGTTPAASPSPAQPQGTPGLPAPPPTPPPTTVAGALPPPVNAAGRLPVTGNPGIDRPPIPATVRPALNEQTARTRITPTTFANNPPANPTGGRRLIATPDGGIRPEPIPLDQPPQVPALESRTGDRAPSARPRLIDQLKKEAERKALADNVPQYVPPEPTPKAAARPTLASKVTTMDKPLPPPDTDEYEAEVAKPHKDRYLSTVNGFGPDIPVPTDEALMAELSKRLSKADAKEAFEFITQEGGWEPKPNELMTLDRYHAGNPPKDRNALLSGAIDQAQKAADVASAPKKLSEKVTSMGSSKIDAVKEIGKRTLAKRVADSPALVAKPSAPRLIPEQTDIDAWENLMDEGKARYNADKHEFEYLAGKGTDFAHSGSKEQAKGLLTSQLGKSGESLASKVGGKRVPDSIGDPERVQDGILRTRIDPNVYDKDTVGYHISTEDNPGTRVGFFSASPDAESATQYGHQPIAYAWLKRPFQRRGIGSRVYNAINSDLTAKGKTLASGGGTTDTALNDSISKAARNMWEKFRAEGKAAWDPSTARWVMKGGIITPREDGLFQTPEEYYKPHDLLMKKIYEFNGPYSDLISNGGTPESMRNATHPAIVDALHKYVENEHDLPYGYDALKYLTKKNPSTTMSLLEKIKGKK